MVMFPIREFEKRFQEILSDMDAHAEQLDGEAAEALEEQNAEFEDALMLLETIDAEDEDWREAVSDALEELDALCADYRRLAEKDSALGALTERMERLVRIAEGNLSNN